MMRCTEHSADRRLSAVRFRRDLRSHVLGLTGEELVTALYGDPLTGVWNRRAFDEASSPSLAILDCDSLKWVNDHEGHDAGDRLIRALADALVNEFGAACVFRLGGDEFVVRGHSAKALGLGLERIRGFRFAGFSYGLGRTLGEADGELRREKRARLARGLRAERGERPPTTSRAYRALAG